MQPHTTALLLIGYQNDYFSPLGVLHQAIEEPARLTGTLRNTLTLMDRLLPTRVLLVTTPIVFTVDYSELKDPVGILKVIKDTGAFRAGSPGAATIAEFARYGTRLLEVPGKRGLNAFSNTRLDEILQAHGIEDVVIGGVVASLCVDSSGRAAHERGYRVSILSDCLSGRTLREQQFYVSEIYPLYATVLTSQELWQQLGT